MYSQSGVEENRVWRRIITRFKYNGVHCWTLHVTSQNCRRIWQEFYTRFSAVMY